MCADLCSDHPPPGKYGCNKQRDFDKCGAEFMIAGDFCQRTCGRCQGERWLCSLPGHACLSIVILYYDTVPWFAVSKTHLNHEAEYAGHCNDIQPPGHYTCAEQKKFGKCDEHYIRDWGYCASTCERCDSAYLSPMLSADIHMQPFLLIRRTSQHECGAHHRFCCHDGVG